MLTQQLDFESYSLSILYTSQNSITSNNFDTLTHDAYNEVTEDEGPYPNPENHIKQYTNWVVFFNDGLIYPVPLIQSEELK